MKIKNFLLEDYFGKYEFTTQYMLSSSDPESFSLQDILNLANNQELKAWHNQSFGYNDMQGSLALRTTIAQELYPTLRPEQIIAFAGAQEGIFCALLTLCNPQDHAIILTPCYQSLQEIPTFTGCAVTTIALQEKNNWRIDLQAIKQAIQPNTKVVVINFPHNPTGSTISQKELEQLVALLKEKNIWLFSDEVYHLLGTPTQPWAQSAAQLYDKAISLGVMSKSYCMPGIRIGWIACQNTEFIQKLLEMKAYTTICNSTPAEVLSTIALRNKDTLLQRTNTMLAENKKHLSTFLQKWNTLFSWVEPEVGCIGFIHYHGKLSVDDLCALVREKASILLLPGSVYNIEYKNYFRIGFGRKNMPEVLQKLDTFLEQEKDNL